MDVREAMYGSGHFVSRRPDRAISFTLVTYICPQLWMLALAHFLGLILQTMSARLGVVTGKNLARVRDVGFV